MTGPRSDQRVRVGCDPALTKARKPAEPAADSAIEAACRALRMPTIRERFVEFTDAATREHASYRAFLAALLSAECDDRETRRQARKVREAGFPRDKRIEAFDFDANRNVPPALIGQLATADWVRSGSRCA